MSWNNDTDYSSDAYGSKNRELPPHPEHRQEQAPPPAPSAPPVSAPAPAYGGNNQQQGGQSQGYGGNRQGGGGGYGGGQRQGGYGGGGGGYGGQRQGGGANGFQRKVLTPEELQQYKLYKTVTFTGENNFPDSLVPNLIDIIKEIENNDFVIRHSALRGFDEEVCRVVRNGEFHVPWKGFGDKESKFSYTPEEAKEIAKRCYPGWENLKLPMQGFSALKVRMLLGKDLKSATQMLIIWTEDGAESVRERTQTCGFTGIAIDVANQMKIPVFNLQRADALERIRAFLNKS